MSKIWDSFDDEHYKMVGEIDSTLNYTQWKNPNNPLNGTGMPSFSLGAYTFAPDTFLGQLQYAVLKDFWQIPSLDNLYMNGQKPLLFISSGTEATVFKFGVSANGSLLIDLADLFGITPESQEGDNGWVTVWIDAEGSLDIPALGASTPVVIGVIPQDFDITEPATADYREGLDMYAGQVTLPGFVFTLAEWTPGVPPEFFRIQWAGQTQVGVDIVGGSYNLISFEVYRKLLIDAIESATPGLNGLSGLRGSLISNFQDIPVRTITYDDGSWQVYDGQWVSPLKLHPPNTTDLFANYFYIDVPQGTSELRIITTGGTGDASLSIRYGQRPDGLYHEGEYTYGSNNVGNEESITISNPPSGKFYIMLATATEYDGVALVANLTAVLPPSKATSPNPSNEAQGQSINVDLSWSNGGGAINYDVYFGTNSSAVSNATHASPEFKGNRTSTSYDPGTLVYSTTYYWSIDANNTSGITPGDVWSFTTIVAPPAKATSPTPANAATGVSVTTDLSWTAGSGATSHDVYFGTVSPGTFKGNQAATNYDTNTMVNNTTYYWRIDEKNAGGTTTGDVWSFKTVVAMPGKATAPSPATGATGVGITTDLSWTAGSGATSYDVYFGTVSPPPFSTNRTVTNYDTNTMANNTTYYWRIDEKNAGGTTTGNVWSFKTVAGAPGKATAPSPATGATGVGIKTDLSWTAGSDATSHDVYFGTVSPGTFKGNQAGTTFDTGTMTNNTTYYWRIDENNAGGTTTGKVWSFKTEPPPPPLLSISAPDNQAAETAAGEPANTGAFRISRTGNTTNPVTVSFTRSGTAKFGAKADYTLSGNGLTATTVVIPAGNDHVDITVTPVDNLVAEPNETVILTLKANKAYNLTDTISQRTATITILDNEPTISISAPDNQAAETAAGKPTNTGTFRISRTGNTTNPVTVSFTRSGKAKFRSDYTLMQMVHL